MRRAAQIAVIALIVAACSDGSADVAEVQSPPPRVTVDLLPTPVGAPDTPPVDARPQYQGFGTLQTERGFGTLQTEQSTLVAMARGDLEVFATPGDDSPERTLSWTTILGTVTVLTVVGQPIEGWAKVMLPVRPNGSTGFVRVEDVEIYAVGGKIVIDLSERELTYTIDGNEVLSTTVAIGSSRNSTPIGSFFVTDSVTLANPNSLWGPHALGLSARSDTITEYNGGDGIIGIHGTNNPSSIGRAVSLGCIRLPNEMITLLHRMVPIGTPVKIRA